MFLSCSLSLGLTGDRQEQFELWGKLIFGIEPIREINSSNSAVCVDLHTESLDIVGTVSSTSEIRQVKLNLVPAFIKSHGHCANEGLDTSSGLIVGSSESTSDGLVVEYLDLECEVFLEVLDDHDQERKLN
jgi:hypothetical protein